MSDYQRSNFKKHLFMALDFIIPASIVLISFPSSLYQPFSSKSYTMTNIIFTKFFKFLFKPSMDVLTAMTFFTSSRKKSLLLSNTHANVQTNNILTGKYSSSSTSIPSSPPSSSSSSLLASVHFLPVLDLCPENFYLDITNISISDFWQNISKKYDSNNEDNEHNNTNRSSSSSSSSSNNDHKNNADGEISDEFILEEEIKGIDFDNLTPFQCTLSIPIKTPEDPTLSFPFNEIHETKENYEENNSGLDLFSSSCDSSFETANSTLDNTDTDNEYHDHDNNTDNTGDTGNEENYLISSNDVNLFLDALTPTPALCLTSKQEEKVERNKHRDGTHRINHINEANSKSRSGSDKEYGHDLKRNPDLFYTVFPKYGTMKSKLNQQKHREQEQQQQLFLPMSTRIDSCLTSNSDSSNEKDEENEENKENEKDINQSLILFDDDNNNNDDINPSISNHDFYQDKNSSSHSILKSSLSSSSSSSSSLNSFQTLSLDPIASPEQLFLSPTLPYDNLVSTPSTTPSTSSKDDIKKDFIPNMSGKNNHHDNDTQVSKVIDLFHHWDCFSEVSSTIYSDNDTYDSDLESFYTNSDHSNDDDSSYSDNKNDDDDQLKNNSNEKELSDDDIFKMERSKTEESDSDIDSDLDCAIEDTCNVKKNDEHNDDDDDDKDDVIDGLSWSSTEFSEDFLEQVEALCIQ